MKKILLLMCAFVASLTAGAQPTAAPAAPDPAPYAQKVGVVYSNYFGMGLGSLGIHYNSSWGNTNSIWSAIEEPVISGERKVLHVTGSGFAHRLTKYNDRSVEVKANEKQYTDVHLMVYPMSATTLYVFQDNNTNDIQSASVTPNQWNAVTISVPSTWTANFYGLYLMNGETLETEFYMDDFYFTNADSYIAPVAQTLGSISLPRYIFCPTQGYNFNVKLLDTTGEEFNGDASISWDGASPVGAKINGNNIIFGAASGTGTFTLKATSGETTVTTQVYFVGTAPTAPETEDVFAPIYTESQIAAWGVVYNGGAQNNGEMILDNQKATDFGVAKCVFFTNNTLWSDIYNVNINPTSAGYGKLCLSIYSPIAATGKVTLEGTKKIAADNAFSLTAGVWKQIEVDLDGETFIKAMSVRMDGGEEILISNIYFTKAGENEDAGKIANLIVSPQIVAADVATALTLTAKDNKGADITEGVTYSATGLSEGTLTASAGAVTITGSTNDGAETATAIVYAVDAPVRTNTGDDIEILQSGKSNIGQGTEWEGGYESLGYLTYSDNTKAYHASNAKTVYLTNPGLSAADLVGYKKFHVEIFSTIDNDNCEIVLENINATAKFSVNAGEWVSVEVPFNGGNDNSSWIKIRIDGGESGAGVAELVIDNVYFSKKAVVVPFNITSEGVVTGEVTSANIAAINACSAAVINLSEATITESITITPTNQNAVIVVGGTERTPDDNGGKVTASNGNLVVFDGAYRRAAEGHVITLVDDNNSQPAYDFVIDAQTDGFTYTRTIVADAWVSYNSPAPVTIPEGVTVYKATGATSGSVTFTKQTSHALGANEPVILHNATVSSIDIISDNAKIDLNLTANPGGAAVNETSVTQYGTFRAIDCNGSQYALQGGESLKQFNAGAKIGAFRVYFTGLSTSSAAIAIFNDGETTKIATINAEGEIRDAEVYDLNGRRVQNPTKGLYIVNGKKVIIK